MRHFRTGVVPYELLFLMVFGLLMNGCGGADDDSSVDSSAEESGAEEGDEASEEEGGEASEEEGGEASEEEGGEASEEEGGEASEEEGGETSEEEGGETPEEEGGETPEEEGGETPEEEGGETPEEEGGETSGEAGESVEDPASCEASCGSQSITGNCFCDAACVENNNCCDDFAEFCPDLIASEEGGETSGEGAESVEDPASCEASCGGQSITGNCFCDDACVENNNCCDDFAEFCPDLIGSEEGGETSEEEGGGDPAPESCEDSCGEQSNTGFCFCDDLCEGFGDCCDDFAEFCPDLIGSEEGGETSEEEGGETSEEEGGETSEEEGGETPVIPLGHCSIVCEEENNEFTTCKKWVSEDACAFAQELDCPTGGYDWSDEEQFCEEDDGLTCDEGETPILSGQICDGIADCEDGSDEVDCTPAQLIPNLKVELSWTSQVPADPNLTPLLQADVDLHFVHPNATGPDIDGDGEPDGWFDTLYDAFWFNPEPNWGSFLPGVADDPVVVTDNEDDPFTETVTLKLCEPGLEYLVGAHYWNDNDYGSAEATVTVSLDGEVIYQASQELVKQDMWEVGRVACTEGGFTPLDKLTPEYQNPIFFNP